MYVLRRQDGHYVARLGTRGEGRHTRDVKDAEVYSTMRLALEHAEEGEQPVTFASQYGDIPTRP